MLVTVLLFPAGAARPVRKSFHAGVAACLNAGMPYFPALPAPEKWVRLTCLTLNARLKEVWARDPELYFYQIDILNRQAEELKQMDPREQWANGKIPPRTVDNGLNGPAGT
jgi:hypothetical protein